VPKLVNTKTRVAENVPADQAADLFRSGSYNLPGSERIALNDPLGNPVNIDAAEVYEALNNGYSFADEEQIRKEGLEAQYGQGLANDLKATAAGAARGATFGLSDAALTGSGLVAPETLAGLEEANPVASTVGEGAGIVGSLLAPVATPVGAIAKAGRAVEGAVASKLATETTKGIARKVIEKSAPLAAGSAVEGAFYGAGQVLTDHALGDPDLTAEKALSEIGLSTALSAGIGGALGLGIGMFGKRAGKTAKAAGVIDEADEYLPPMQDPTNPANLVQSIDEMSVSENTRKSIVEGLTERKKNADDILEAAKVLDAPVLESQISASKHVQDMDSMLMQSPTPIGVARQQMAMDGIEKAEKAVVETLSDATDQSLAEVGSTVKTTLLGKINKEAEPITAMYDNLTQFGQIPVAPRSLKQVARNIEHLEGIGKISPGSASAKLQKRIARELPNLKTVEDIKTYKKILRNETNLETKYIRGRILEKLDNLEESSILKAAEDFKGVPELEAMMKELVKQNSEVKGLYKAFRGKLEELGGALGKKRIYGKQDFVDFVEDLTPEKLASRLFAKNDSQFLKFFSENFPEETAALLRYQRSQILTKATKDGVVNVNQVLREVDKFSPELKALLFTPEQLSRVKAAKTYMESLPKNINPSGTSKSEAYRRFFSNPISATLETARDYATQVALEKVIDKTAGESARGVRTLIGLERLGNGSVNRLAKGVKTALTTSTGPGYLGAKLANRDNVPRGTYQSNSEANEEPTKRFQNRVDNIAKLTRDTGILLETLEKSTNSIYPYAPRVTAGLHASMIRAVSFLQAKLPKNPNTPRPLSAPWVPPASEIAKFDRYYEAVENPMVALEQIGDGTLTTETVEAVVSVYPKLYQAMSQELLTRVVDMGPEKVPYQKKLMLSLFLNEDLDESTTSEAIASNQATILGPSQQQDAQQPVVRPTQGGASKLTVGSRALTPQQQSAARTA
jgi:hypothetical protein